MLRSTMKLSEAEVKLLEAIHEVGYGEMFGVEVPHGAPNSNREVSKNFKDLVEFVRDGNQYIDVLTIHQGEPVTAEIDQEIKGFRCRKKRRFPTA